MKWSSVLLVVYCQQVAIFLLWYQWKERNSKLIRIHYCRQNTVYLSRIYFDKKTASGSVIDAFSFSFALMFSRVYSYVWWDLTRVVCFFFLNWWRVCSLPNRDMRKCHDITESLTQRCWTTRCSFNHIKYFLKVTQLYLEWSGRVSVLSSSNRKQ